MSDRINSILLVDDDSITNFLNESLLQKMNVAEKVDTAEDGVEALNFIKENWRDEGCGSSKRLIFLDVNMPLMNGFEFLEEFRKLDCSKSVPVVLLTTSSNSKDLEMANKYNLKGYILKPLSPDKLQEVLNDIK